MKDQAYWREYIGARVKIDANGCWIWQRTIKPNGYGIFTEASGCGRRTSSAHRRAYEAFIGPIPDGLCVCHHCDVRSCCNPSHLFAGTKAENTRDMIAKGRRVAAAPKGEASGLAKLSTSEVRQIRILSKIAGQRKLGRRFGVSKTQIRRIIAGQSWPHLP